MTDDVYGYDTALYDRSFLNCYQRQAMVLLAEGVPDLAQLFHHCLVSSDAILEHAIRLGRPKYEFPSELLDPQALARVGVTREYRPFPTYAAARPALLGAVAEHRHAIPFIDVFYLPHCPEYRVDHVVHTVVLVEHHPRTREWSILDDNRASVLCRYRYSEDVVAAAYDNGRLRHVSWFPTTGYDAEAAARESGAAFADVIDGFEDGHLLLSGVGDLLADPWISVPRTVALLYDAFALHEGSRSCLREFVRRQPRYTSAEPVLDEIVRLTKDLRNRLMIGKATGRLAVAGVAAACQDLKTTEENLVELLRDARPAEVGR